MFHALQALSWTQRMQTALKAAAVVAALSAFWQVSIAVWDAMCLT